MLRSSYVCANILITIVEVAIPNVIKVIKLK